MSQNGSGGHEEQCEHEGSVANSLDVLTDTELIKLTEELQLEVRQLEMENQVFENFLLKNDPGLIAGMAQTLEIASKMQSQTQSLLTPPGPERKSTDESIRASSRKTESVVRFATTTSAAEKGPR